MSALTNGPIDIVMDRGRSGFDDPGYRSRCPGYVNALLEEIDQLTAAGRVVVAAGDRHFEAARVANERADVADADCARLRSLLENTLMALEGLMDADIVVTGYTDDRRLTRARHWADEARKAAREEVGR